MKEHNSKPIHGVSSHLQPTSLVADVVADGAVSSATNYLDILGRMKLVTGTKSDTAFAQSIGLRQSSVSAAKERQSIPPAWAVQIAQDYGVSLDWLMFGKGEAKREAAQERPEPAQAAPVRAETVATTYNDMGQPAANIADLVAKTIEVLQSQTVFQTALQSNIEAFHHAIVLEKKIDQVEDRIMGKISGRLDALETSNHRLEAENAQLRQELEQSRAESAVRNTG